MFFVASIYPYILTVYCMFIVQNYLFLYTITINIGRNNVSHFFHCLLKPILLTGGGAAIY